MSCPQCFCNHPQVMPVVLSARLLGLEVCIDTCIGNDLLKGISGGQRKRVTSGELIQEGIYRSSDCTFTITLITIVDLSVLLIPSLSSEEMMGGRCNLVCLWMRFPHLIMSLSWCIWSCPFLQGRWWSVDYLACLWMRFPPALIALQPTSSPRVWKMLAITWM